MREQLVFGERLFDVVERAHLHRQHGVLDRTVRGHHDDRRRRTTRAHRRKDFDAVVLADPQVGQDQIVVFLRDERSGFVSIRSHVDFVTGTTQEQLEALAHVG